MTHEKTGCASSASFIFYDATPGEKMVNSTLLVQLELLNVDSKTLFEVFNV